MRALNLLTGLPAAVEQSVTLERAMPPLSADTVPPPVREFLTWVASRPRTYADAMEAWRSSCPRYTIWEDALAAGFIDIAPSRGRVAEARVILTPRGQAVLTSH